MLSIRQLFTKDFLHAFEVPQQVFIHTAQTSIKPALQMGDGLLAPHGRFAPCNPMCFL